MRIDGREGEIEEVMGSLKKTKAGKASTQDDVALEMRG